MRMPTHAAVSKSVDLARLVVGHRPAGSSTPCCARSPHRTLDGLGGAGGSRRRGRPARRTWRCVRSHPRLDRRASSRRGPAGARRDELDALLAADNSPPRVTLVARPGRARSTSCCRPAVDPGRCRRTPSRSIRWRSRRRSQRSARAVPASRTKAPSLWRWLLAAAPVEGSDDALARHVRRAGRQGRPAGSRSPRNEGMACLAAELQPHRAELVRRALGRTPRARSGSWSPTPPCRPGSRAPSTGCCSTRRAAGWARCADGRRRAGASEPPTSPAWSRCSSGCCAAALRRVRPGGVVVYSTCTPVLDETAGVVSAVLADGERRAGAGDPTVVAACRTPRARSPAPLQLWPHRHQHRRHVPGGAAQTVRTSTRSTDPIGSRPRMGIQISPSILSATSPTSRPRRGGSQNADWLHVDVMDNHFVPNLTLGAPVVEALSPGDRHPDRLPPDDRGPRPVGAGVHRGGRRSRSRSTSRPPPRPVRLARELRARAAAPGWRCARPPRWSPTRTCLPELDMLLIMTVEPGFGGQKFLDLCLPKIRRARTMLDRGTAWTSGSRSTAASRSTTIERCAEAGADVFVAGSAVFGADDPGAHGRRSSAPPPRPSRRPDRHLPRSDLRVRAHQWLWQACPDELSTRVLWGR